MKRLYLTLHKYIFLKYWPIVDCHSRSRDIKDLIFLLVHVFSQNVFKDRTFKFSANIENLYALSMSDCTPSFAVVTGWKQKPWFLKSFFVFQYWVFFFSSKVDKDASVNEEYAFCFKIDQRFLEYLSFKDWNREFA